MRRRSQLRVAGAHAGGIATGFTYRRGDAEAPAFCNLGVCDAGGDRGGLHAGAGGDRFVGIGHGHRQAAQFAEHLSVRRTTRPTADDSNRVERGVFGKSIERVEQTA